MKLQLFLLAALALSTVTATTEKKRAPLLAENSPSRVKGEYVVVFDDTISDENVTSHLSTVQNMIDYYGNKTNKLLREFHIGSFRGYGALMDDKLRDNVRLMDNIRYVECSQYFYAIQDDTCSLQTRATWGIVRTTFRDIPPLNDYSYAPNDGEDIKVYIIDTGIYTQHPDFGGRAEWGVDFIDDPSPRTDLNGHGTHCAGTVMSNTWGLARKATSIAVRVLDQNGSGTTAGVIDGVNYVAGKATKNKSVANMSLGGGRSTALNTAVDKAVAQGVSFAVAAGNENQDACNVSPASAESCVTVGASDSDDQFAYFSNWGTCEDIIAPGVDITSTWLNGETNTISGTSMAAPHVAGVMAKYLSSSSMSPAELKALITNKATPNKINGLVGSKSKTPNKLVFKECVG